MDRALDEETKDDLDEMLEVLFLEFVTEKALAFQGELGNKFNKLILTEGSEVSKYASDLQLSAGQMDDPPYLQTQLAEFEKGLQSCASTRKWR